MNQQPSENPVSITLFELRWKKRVLVLHSPDPEYQALTEQKSAITKAKTEITERNIVLIEVFEDGTGTYQGQPMDQESVNRAKKNLNLTDEEPSLILLVGKDGGVKLREKMPIELTTIFKLIDSMPIRKAEMNDL